MFQIGIENHFEWDTTIDSKDMKTKCWLLL